MRATRPPAASVVGIMLWLGLLAGPAAAEAPDWASPLLGRELVIVQKTSAADPSPPRPLPPAVEALFGPDFVDYDAFVAVRLPAAEAQVLRQTAFREGWDGLLEAPQPVALPFQTFHPEHPREREGGWNGRSVRPAPRRVSFWSASPFP